MAENRQIAPTEVIGKKHHDIWANYLPVTICGHAHHRVPAAQPANENKQWHRMHRILRNIYFWTRLFLIYEASRFHSAGFITPSLPQRICLRFAHSVGIYSETTHNLATVVSARPAPAACFYNPKMPIRACAVQYAFDAFINSEFGSRLKWQVWQLASYQLSACVLK